MNPIIKEFSQYHVSELYELISEIYSTSDAMSETLEEKYPNLESFQNHLTSTSTLCAPIALIAEINNIPMAYLTITPKKQSRLRHTAELSMGIRSEAREKGLGKHILNEAILKARKSEFIEIIYLHVRADNIPAVQLYEKCGFERLTLLEHDTKINNRYYNGILMRQFVK